jgi:hypothetical protein
MIELERKAFDYRREVVPETYLGYPDVEIPMYSALDIDRAYLAGAKENQPNAEEMLKRLMKGGYIESGISNEKLKAQIEKMKNCANCKFGYLGEADMFENCRNCTMMYCICQKTKKEMDWDEKCDSWELAE